MFSLKLTWPEAETRRSIKNAPPSYADASTQLTSKAAHRTQPRAKVTQHHAFLNTTWADFDILFNGGTAVAPEDLDANDHKCREVVRIKAQPVLTTPKPGGFIYNLSILPSSHELRSSGPGQRLFQFYANQMCPKCPFVDGYNNSYRKVIIPLSLQSPLLLNSVLATAANQLKFFDPQYTTTALQYRGTTLRSLTRVFTDDNHRALSRTETLGIVLMLCMYDMSNNESCKSSSSAMRDQAWWIHLQGARRLMELRHDNPCDEAVPSMLGQYLSAYSILAYTTLVDDVQESVIFEGASYWLAQVARPAQEVQCFTGCSHELLGIILDICAQIRARKNNRLDISLVDLETWRRQIEARLHSLVQWTPAELTSRLQPEGSPGSAASRPHPEDVRNVPARTAECFRLAALILVQHLDLNCPLDANPTVAQSVNSILKLMGEATQYVPAEGKSGRSSYLWPYFIAACHVKTDDDRAFILDRMEHMRQVVGAFISTTVLEPIRETVQLVWKQQDLRRHAYPGNSLEREDTCFEWESVMRALGYRLNWV
ncbi:hypothetical protein LTR10_016616 [Elasticomyces elasticus]|uniref:Transcription factor domain-containing protein n=1 Tax=Exophiala sideris TaxID=1016849 RepID=A0ABR0JJM8_9EURO|nr:hypothetical protein LTR10_016616 [Elasticomyces elasticus]KAK5035261.1 hypothetical protein LTS07_002697 [Exophiala sideris]KAK5039387.1 hypothetical protein LTR13_003644 [Exophiala sideris]KAK5066185.1 hypothetical protein LTR69_002703 [Exophiala sideris]KAK5186862.1 hypothetical protein LTR44_000868 [Eurotiomycetes sp. CCFEE 6388]